MTDLDYLKLSKPAKLRHDFGLFLKNLPDFICPLLLNHNTIWRIFSFSKFSKKS